MIPAAGIEFRGSDAYVGAKSDCQGALIGDGPIEVVSDFRENLVLLGLAVHRALGRSRHGAPRPADWNELTKPYLELARVNSWRDFIRRSVSVTIVTKDGQLEAYLWGSSDRHGSQSGVEGAVRYLSPDEDPGTIGQILVELAIHSGHLNSR